MVKMVIQGGMPLMEVADGELWKVVDLGPLRPRVRPGSMLDRVAAGPGGGYVVVQDREGARSGVPVEARLATPDEIAQWTAAAAKTNEQHRRDAATPITPDLMDRARAACVKAEWVRLAAIDRLVILTTLSRAKAEELVDLAFDAEARGKPLP